MAVGDGAGVDADVGVDVAVGVAVAPDGAPPVLVGVDAPGVAVPLVGVGAGPPLHAAGYGPAAGATSAAAHAKSALATQETCAMLERSANGGADLNVIRRRFRRVRYLSHEAQATPAADVLGEVAVERAS